MVIVFDLACACDAYCFLGQAQLCTRGTCAVVRTVPIGEPRFSVCCERGAGVLENAPGLPQIQHEGCSDAPDRPWRQRQNAIWIREYHRTSERRSIGGARHRTGEMDPAETWEVPAETMLALDEGVLLCIAWLRRCGTYNSAPRARRRSLT